MAWILLFIAGVLEVAWAYFMKQSGGFSKFWPSVVTLVLMGVSFGLLSLSMRTLPLGTAYAIWTGIGAVGSLAVGIMVMGEAATPLRLLGGGLIISGLIVVKVATPN